MIDSLIDLGFDVLVEAGAGSSSGFTDTEFVESGATIVDALPDGLDVSLRVTPPTDADAEKVTEGGAIVGFLDPTVEQDRYASHSGVHFVAIESIPRTTLAQAMDALSSQATSAGYAAVLVGATRLPKFMPMLVTAAGTIAPAKVLILGVGVAGLQAIATARRLGAIVYAYDIRPETKEQVESLGGRFVEAPTQQMDEGGYARSVDEDTATKQREVLAAVVADSDLIVTTAQVPGRAAPRLIDRSMVEAMEAGSIIVDMAAASGGNVEGSLPDQEIDIDGVTILGPTDLASRVAADSSRMFSRNLLEVLKRMVDEGALVVDPEDAVVGPALVGGATDE